MKGFYSFMFYIKKIMQLDIRSYNAGVIQLRQLQ